VGHLKGGLGHVVVVSAMIFAGMTGAAVAEAAAIGTVGIEGMAKKGFDRKFCSAIIGSARPSGRSSLPASLWSSMAASPAHPWAGFFWAVFAG
jgi:TRAP-type C4-dicarboxylate transport system permease large subunit